MLWTPKGCSSDVETNSDRSAGYRRIAAAETDVSDVLACLCGRGFGARDGLPDFDKVPAAAHSGVPRHQCFCAWLSRFTPPRLRAVRSWPCCGGCDCDWQVLFRYRAGNL